MSEKLKVLVCEDNLLAQKVLQFSLQKMGFEILVANDGEKGINIVKEQPVDLVVTDLNMPYNNGLELIRYLRTHVTKKIPVIIVSNINQEETKKLAKELGADNYLTKPFDPNQLSEIILSLGLLK